MITFPMKFYRPLYCYCNLALYVYAVNDQHISLVFLYRSSYRSGSKFNFVLFSKLKTMVSIMGFCLCKNILNNTVYDVTANYSLVTCIALKTSLSLVASHLSSDFWNIHSRALMHLILFCAVKMAWFHKKFSHSRSRCLSSEDTVEFPEVKKVSWVKVMETTWIDCNRKYMNREIYLG